MKEELKTLNIASLKAMHATLKKASDNIKKFKELRTASIKNPKVKNNTGDLNTASRTEKNINLAQLDADARKVQIKKSIKEKGLANCLAETMK